MTLNAKNFGLAAGILWAAVMFVFTWISLWTGYAEAFLLAMGTIYLGYKVSALGSIVGAVYGFVDAFIFFWLLAWLYNKLEARKS